MINHKLLIMAKYILVVLCSLIATGYTQTISFDSSMGHTFCPTISESTPRITIEPNNGTGIFDIGSNTTDDFELTTDLDPGASHTLVVSPRGNLMGRGNFTVSYTPSDGGNRSVELTVEYGTPGIYPLFDSVTLPFSGTVALAYTTGFGEVVTCCSETHQQLTGLTVVPDKDRSCTGDFKGGLRERGVIRLAVLDTLQESSSIYLAMESCGNPDPTAISLNFTYYLTPPSQAPASTVTVVPGEGAANTVSGIVIIIMIIIAVLMLTTIVLVISVWSYRRKKTFSSYLAEFDVSSVRMSDCVDHVHEAEPQKKMQSHASEYTMSVFTPQSGYLKQYEALAYALSEQCSLLLEPFNPVSLLSDDSGYASQLSHNILGKKDHLTFIIWVGNLEYSDKCTSIIKSLVSDIESRGRLTPTNAVLVQLGSREDGIVPIIPHHLNVYTVVESPEDESFDPLSCAQKIYTAVSRDPQVREGVIAKSVSHEAVMITIESSPSHNRLDDIDAALPKRVQMLKNTSADDSQKCSFVQDSGLSAMLRELQDLKKSIADMKDEELDNVQDRIDDVEQLHQSGNSTPNPSSNQASLPQLVKDAVKEEVKDGTTVEGGKNMSVNTVNGAEASLIRSNIQLVDHRVSDMDQCVGDDIALTYSLTGSSTQSKGTQLGDDIDIAEKKQHMTNMMLVSGSCIVNSTGGTYYNRKHDVSLVVPPGAVGEQSLIEVKMDAFLHTDLTFPEGVQPVSATVQMCVVDQPNFKFHKPVKITIPHFLNITNEADIEKGRICFYKAKHRASKFHETDGEASFDLRNSLGQHYGTLETTHFCSFCIVHFGSKEEIGRILPFHFQLVKVMLVDNSNPRDRMLYFYVTFRIATCKRMIENWIMENHPEYNSKEIDPLCSFNFNEISNITCNVTSLERNRQEGWHLVQKNNLVSADQIPFWCFHNDYLKDLEENGLYPPRFAFKVHAEQHCKYTSADFEFKGMYLDMFKTSLELSPFPIDIKFYSLVS